MFIDDIIRAGGRVYKVGGTVRDNLLKRKTKDRDYLVTNLPVDKILSVLKPHGKVTLVGKSFGVIKFTPHGEVESEIDIAIPRKEISTGTGHRDFEVQFDPNIPVEEDLGRRDFTINAMALEVATENLIDPFSGEADLKNKILKQVFPNSFVEDPLRLLRAVQFSARFELNIDDETLKAMKNHAGLIKTVSSERIVEEIKKLFLAEKPSNGFELMDKTGLLRYVLPELAATVGILQAKQAGDDVFGHTMKVLNAARNDPEIGNSGNLELMFAALLHDIGKAKTQRYSEKNMRTVFFGHQIVSARIARKILERWKVTTIGVDPLVVCTLIENHMFETKSYYSERAIRRFINKIGKDLILKLIDFRIADNRGGKHPSKIKGILKLKDRIIEEINKKPPFGPKDLAINGHDIMGLGVSEGPMIGKMISAIVDKVLENPSLNTREQLIAFCEELKDKCPWEKK